jgi:hypothetical protein
MTLLSGWSVFLGGRNVCDLASNETTDDVQLQKRIGGLARDPSGPTGIEIKDILSAFVPHGDFISHAARFFIRVLKFIGLIPAMIEPVAFPPGTGLAALLVRPLFTEMPFAVPKPRWTIAHLERSGEIKFAKLVSPGILADIAINPAFGTVNRRCPLPEARLGSPQPTQCECQ